MIPPALVSRLRTCQSLPSPPNIVLSLLQLTEDITAPARKFADLIEKDPALAAQILRIVNSPMYSLRREITSLQHAVAHVGIHGIRILALGFALSRGLLSVAPRAEMMNHLRERSVLASVTARELAETVGLKRLEEIFLGSLMQDIGVFALLEVLGDSYESILESAKSDHSWLAQEENRLLFTDHTAVGAWLLDRWGLPTVLQEMVACSHQRDLADGDLSLRCVAASGPLSDALLIPGEGRRFIEEASNAADLLGVDCRRVNRALERAAQRVPEIAQLFNLDISADEYETTLMKAQQAAFSIGLQGMVQVRKREEILEALSGQVDRLKTESRTDALTGVFNRRFLDEAVEASFQEAVSEGLTFGLCFCDLDNLKVVNDRLGHSAGDLALKTVAESLKETLRQGDFVGRYGGDEFLVLLRGCPADMTEAVCKRLQEMVSRRLQGPRFDPEVSCSISIGYAVQSGRHPFSTSKRWIEAADEALYQAKQLGRNTAVGHQMKRPGTRVG